MFSSQWQSAVGSCAVFCSLHASFIIDWISHLLYPQYELFSAKVSVDLFMKDQGPNNLQKTSHIGPLACSHT